MSVFNNKKYVEERMQFHEGDQVVSDKTYNLTLGGVLLYGFVIDAIIAVAFSGYAKNAILSENSALIANFGIIAVVTVIAYLILGIVGAFMVHGSDNPIVSFIGFNFFAIPTGFLLAFLVLPFYSVSTIATAFVLTAIITAVMIIVSMIIPDTFASMGKGLFISLLVTLIVSVVSSLMGVHLVFISYIMIFIFALFIGYDWVKANRCVKTIDNAVDCAAELYLDIINVFLRVLEVIGDSH